MASHIIVAAILIMGIVSTSSVLGIPVGVIPKAGAGVRGIISWIWKKAADFRRSIARQLKDPAVHETIEFTFEQATDYVLSVTKDNYDTCNAENPLQKIGGGYPATFELITLPELYYFISGNATKCNEGMKFYVDLSSSNESPASSMHPPNYSSTAPSESSASSVTIIMGVVGVLGHAFLA